MPKHPVLRSWLVVLAFTVAACGGGSDERPLAFSDGTSRSQDDGTVKLLEASRPYVKAVAAEASPGGDAVRAPARVAFRNGAVSKVHVPVGGRVTEVRVKVGDHVAAGDPLVVLESPEAADARAALAEATTEAEEARREVARQDQMARTGVDVPSERAAAAAKLREAEANLDGVRAKTAFLGQGSGLTVIVQAPAAGNVMALAATTGAYADPNGEEVAEIANPSSTWIVADVFERDLPLVSEGARATIDVPSVSGRLVGHVAGIGASLEGNIRTAPVYLSLDEEVPALRAGMYARATVEAGNEPGISLPAAAVLVKDGSRTVVYTQVGDDVFKPRDVKVGASIDGKVRVLSGLAPGEKVVVEGALLLDGAAEQML